MPDATKPHIQKRLYGDGLTVDISYPEINVNSYEYSAECPFCGKFNNDIAIHSVILLVMSGIDNGNMKCSECGKQSHLNLYNTIYYRPKIMGQSIGKGKHRKLFTMKEYKSEW